MAQYVPGQCNIGRAERRRRYRIAAVGFAVAALYVAWVALSDAPAVLSVGAFAPLAVAVEWYVQGRQAFCVRLATRGAYSVGDEAGRVSSEDARRTDRRYAAKLTALSLAVAAVVTGAVYAALA